MTDNTFDEMMGDDINEAGRINPEYSYRNLDRPATSSWNLNSMDPIHDINGTLRSSNYKSELQTIAARQERHHLSRNYPMQITQPVSEDQDMQIAQPLSEGQDMQIAQPLTVEPDKEAENIDYGIDVLFCIDICDTFHDFFINKENVLILTDWLDHNYNKLSGKLKSSKKLSDVVYYIKKHIPNVNKAEFKTFITDLLFTDNPSNFIRNNNKLLIANVSEIHTRQISNKDLLFHGAIDYHKKGRQKQSSLIKEPTTNYVINVEKFDSDDTKPSKVDYTLISDNYLLDKEILTLSRVPILENNKITMFGQNSKFDQSNEYPLICEFNVGDFNFKVKCKGGNNTVNNMFALAMLFSGKYIIIERKDDIEKSIVGIDKIDFTKKKELMQKLLKNIDVINDSFSISISIKNNTENIDQLPLIRKKSGGSSAGGIRFYDSEQAYLDSADYYKCSTLKTKCKLIEDRKSTGNEIIKIDISSDSKQISELISELKSKDEDFFKIVFLELITCFFSIKRTGDRIPILYSYLNPQFVLNNQDTYARIYNYFLIKACDRKDDRKDDENKRSVLLNASVDVDKGVFYWNDKYLKYKKKYLELKKKIRDQGL